MAVVVDSNDDDENDYDYDDDDFYECHRKKEEEAWMCSVHDQDSPHLVDDTSDGEQTPGNPRRPLRSYCLGQYEMTDHLVLGFRLFLGMRASAEVDERSARTHLTLSSRCLYRSECPDSTTL